MTIVTQEDLRVIYLSEMLLAGVAMCSESRRREGVLWQNFDVPSAGRVFESRGPPCAVDVANEQDVNRGRRRKLRYYRCGD